MSRVFAALVVVLSSVAAWEGAAVAPARAAPARSEAGTMGLPLPPRTRIDPRHPHLFTSGRGFRATVKLYQRVLARRGIAHEAIPVYRYRGVAVARFLSRQPGTAWSAIQVYHQEGRTWIYLVPQSS